MGRKPRADDDEDANICLGFGSISDLRDAPRCKRIVSRPRTGHFRLGGGDPAQTAAEASLDFGYRGDHVAAQPNYLAFGVLRPCNHSRFPFNVSRVRGSGGQMAMASKTPRRMMP